MNRYVELLEKFRTAYAEYGESYFVLSGTALGEFPSVRGAVKNLLGHLDPEGPERGWTVYGSSSHYPIPLTPVALYRDLASQAGAALPWEFRRKLPFRADGPVDWWLALQWYLYPPEEADLTEPAEDYGSVIWRQPFLTSIDVIESCRLHTDHPQFPPDGSKPDDEGEAQKHDGPKAGCRVWYNGRPVKVTGRTYAFIETLWSREFASFDELKKALSSEVSDKTIHTWVNRANNALAPLNLPWVLVADGVNRYVRKQPR